MITCIHQYSILQGSFSALKIPCAPTFTTTPPTPGNHDLFTVSIVLPFPEFHRVGIIESVAFSDWLLSLNNTYLKFLHVFLWPKGNDDYVCHLPLLSCRHHQNNTPHVPRWIRKKLDPTISLEPSPAQSSLDQPTCTQVKINECCFKC